MNKGDTRCNHGVVFVIGSKKLLIIWNLCIRIIVINMIAIFVSEGAESAVDKKVIWRHVGKGIHESRRTDVLDIL